MRPILLTLVASICLVTGCALNHTVLVSTGTVIGVEIAENPSTQLYHAKLGYNRGELAMVPTTNGYTPDVITEIHYSGIFDKGADSGIYQRLAVGPIACAQPGAMAMFLKDSSGNISTNAAAAIKSLATIPAVNPTVQSSLLRIAKLFAASPNKTPWDDVAKTVGYSSFSDLIIDPTITPTKFADTVAALRSAKLIDQ